MQEQSPSYQEMLAFRQIYLKSSSISTCQAHTSIKCFRSSTPLIGKYLTSGVTVCHSQPGHYQACSQRLLFSLKQQILQVPQTIFNREYQQVPNIPVRIQRISRHKHWVECQEVYITNFPQGNTRMGLKYVFLVVNVL